MKLYVKAVVVSAFGCLIGHLCGCASSSNLVNIWHDSSYQARPLAKMLVIAVRKNATQRRIWEDAFAGDLARRGVTATPSYTLLPDAPPDSAQVILTVQSNGFDGILAILTLPTETDTRYVPGHTTMEVNNNYNVYFWPTYWTSYNAVYHPGYVDSQTVGIRSINVTATGSGGRLIWSATSRTPDPGSVTDVQRGIAGLVISELAKQKIISARK